MTTQLLSLNHLSPGANLDAYVNTVSAFPVLSVEQEQALARRFYFEEDLEAARELVLSHLRFVVHIARSYRGYGLPEADLVQEGNVGLMKAVKRFDPDHGVRLVTFAVHWIKAEIHEYVLRNWRIVKVATTKAQRKLFFNLRGAKQRLGWLNAEETSAIADDLGVTKEEVTRMEGRLASFDMAFDGYGDDDDAPMTAPAQYLAANTADPADLVAQNEHYDNAHAQLTEGLSALDSRSRDIIESRWLVDNKATLMELAERYDVSAERIRQLEKAAIKKLKVSFAA